MKLSENFTLEEMCASEWAARHRLDNTPPPDVRANLERLAAALETVRLVCGAKPVCVLSGYRSKLVNSGIGGSETSQHVHGLAADFIIPEFGPPINVCYRLIEAHIAYDQLIHEFGRWVHMSVNRDGVVPRMETLTIADKASGYRKGIHRV